MKKVVETKNLETLKEFDKYNKVNGLAESTREHQSREMRLLVTKVKKDFKDMTDKDIESYLSKCKCSKYTLDTKKIVIKKFFKWLYNTDDYPGIVKWIKLSRSSYNFKKPSEMLTESEVKKLIECCDNLRDKAIFSLLDDTAIRIGELVNLNIEDVANDGENLSITVRGKTGQRNVGLITSAPLINEWLNLHPYKNNPEAPLFISLSNSCYGERMYETGIYAMLQVYKERAGIKKRVTPHLFRHSRLTMYARKGLSESAMRQYAGWTASSSMPEVYIHLTEKDVDDKRRELETGTKPKQVELHTSSLLPITCPRCGKQNDSSNNYCSSCWLPLTRESVQSDLKLLNTFRSKFTRMAIDVDKYIDEYSQFKTVTEEYLEFYNASGGKSIVEVEVLREKLKWNKNRFERFVNGLVETGVLNIENGIVTIQKYEGKSVFDNFLMFKKML